MAPAGTCPPHAPLLLPLPPLLLLLVLLPLLPPAAAAPASPSAPVRVGREVRERPVESIEVHLAADTPRRFRCPSTARTPSSTTRSAASGSSLPQLATQRSSLSLRYRQPTARTRGTRRRWACARCPARRPTTTCHPRANRARRFAVGHLDVDHRRQLAEVTPQARSAGASLAPSGPGSPRSTGRPLGRRRRPWRSSSSSRTSRPAS